MKTKKKHLSQKFAVLANATLVAAFAIPTAHAEGAVGGAVSGQESAVDANVVVGGTLSEQESAVYTIDYENAIPMALPQADVAPIRPRGAVPSARLGVPGHAPGAVGTGKTSPVQTPISKWSDESTDLAAEPQEYGTSKIPYTTSRVDLPGAKTGNNKANGVSLRYPYRATGKLFFNIGSSTYVCSASLIKRGIIVTAAHCVAEFGKKQYYKNWKFHPARYNNSSPYGIWSVNGKWVMKSYFDGTDNCSQAGVVCKNDIAVLSVQPKSTTPTLPGTSTGWYGYGWDGYGFTPDDDAQVAQLGYPVALDMGLKMQRTDSYAFVYSPYVNNTVWGSLQTGGSSGGPELVNFGRSPALSGGVTHGSEANYNTVVGVTSWGSTDNAPKIQGASPFLSTNIKVLVKTACNAKPAACK